MTMQRNLQELPSVGKWGRALIAVAAVAAFGATLAEADGAVKLNHPHCARFCVLGGGSCSGGS